MEAMPLLNYRQYGTNGTSVFILHGIFGMLDNWHYISGRLGEFCRVYSCDARNHGKSFHHPSMDYDTMADDLLHLMNHLHVEKAVIMGHSMGGKTAMHFALKYPERVEKLIVVDIAPKAYRPGHIPYFEAFEQIPFERIQTRREADEALQHYAPDPAVRQFLLKNLEPLPEGGYRAKFNLPALRTFYEEIIGELTLSGQLHAPALFVYGDRSGYVKPEDRAIIENHFPSVQFEAVADAGHWVHADRPEAFLHIVHEFIQA